MEPNEEPKKPEVKVPEEVTDKQKVADLMGIGEDEVTDAIIDSHDFEKPEEPEEKESEPEKKDPPSEKDFDAIAVLNDPENENYDFTKKVVDSLAAKDAVGDKNHPLHKIVADNQKAYTDLKEKMNTDSVEYETQRALQGFKFTEVKAEDDKIILFDNDNDPREGKFGGMTYDEAVDNDSVASFNEAQYNYMDKKKDYLAKKSDFSNIKKTREKQAQDRAEQYESDKKTFTETHEIEPDYVESLEKKYSRVELTFDQVHLLEIVEKAGGVDNYLKNNKLDQGIEDVINAPEGIKNKPISNKDGNMDVGGKKDPFTPASAFEIQGMSDVEFRAYNIEYEQAEKDGKIKKQ